MSKRARRRKKKEKRPCCSIEDLLKEADEWDERYLEVMVHSIGLYAFDRQHELIEEFLSKRRRSAFKVTNAYSKRLWLAELLWAFQRDRWKIMKPGNWKDAFAFVTFTHKEWSCSANNIKFDLVRAKAKVRNALAGVDFIACFEAGAYRNENWVTEGVEGNLISFHCHAIVWAQRWRDLEYLRQQIRPRFEPILGNKNGARFERRTVEEIPGTLTYMAKMPFLGYRTEKSSSGRKVQRTSPKLTFKTRWHLFSALKDKSTFSFWLAGGDGVPWLAEARTGAKARVRRDPVSHVPH